MLVAAMLVMSAAASPLKQYTDAAARQLTDVAGAGRAVLGPEMGQGAVRRYRPEDALQEGGTHK
jgi:hypothetical protein